MASYFRVFRLDLDLRLVDLIDLVPLLFVDLILKISRTLLDYVDEGGFNSNYIRTPPQATNWNLTGTLQSIRKF